MRRARDRSAEIALGVALAAMLAVRAIHPSPIGAWQRVTGAVIPNGTASTSYFGAPLDLMSVTGERWVAGGRREPASAYHVLFLDPPPQLRTGWVYDATPSSWWDRDRWMYTDRARFESRYNPILRSVEMGGRRYWLARGNVFVVRIDRDGEMRVRQLRAHVHDAPEGASALERVLPEAARLDPEVRRILRAFGVEPPRAKRKCGFGADVGVPLRAL